MTCLRSAFYDPTPFPTLECDDEDDLRMAELDAIEEIRAHGIIGSSCLVGSYRPAPLRPPHRRSGWRREGALRKSEERQPPVRVFEVVEPPPFDPAKHARTQEASEKIREIFLRKCMDLPYESARPSRLAQLQDHFNVLIQDFNAKHDTNVPLLPGL